LQVYKIRAFSICGTEFPSCRLILTLMGVFASVNCYTTRVNLSVALVVMVNNTWVAKGGKIPNISPCLEELIAEFMSTVEVRQCCMV